MTRYRVDPARSSITAVVRPRMGPATLPASVTGEVELDHSPAQGRDDRSAAGGGIDGSPRPIEAGDLTGHIQVSLDGQPPVPVDLALAAADAAAELSRGRDGQVVLRGQRSAPAGAFGILGPPLINPTVVLSWRLVLAPL